MHMAFLSRGFKNLQWYGMTAEYPSGYSVFLFSKLFCDSCTETCNFRYPLLLLVEGLVPYYIQEVSYD